MLNKEVRQAAVEYRIRIGCVLDERWSGWFGGWAIQPQENGETTLCNRAADQAELFGVLIKINNLGITLLQVERKEK
jgi:hypothetical protein